MKNLYSKSGGQALTKTALTLMCLYFLFCMIIFPQRFIKSGLNGISAWAFNVLPSVLPFMFFTRLLSSLGTMEKITKPFSKVSSFLFKTPPISIYTFLMAILSGYPVGTKMVADLYLQGKITKTDALKMTSFCSTSGPMFIVGAVGISMFHSAKIGYILLASHILSAIINGIFFRNLKFKNEENLQKIDFRKQNFDISDIVLDSTISILSVGCVITIFFVIIESFAPVFNFLPQPISCFLQGIVEITKGCITLSQISNKFLATILASFVISFGGISTIIQSKTMLKRLKMPTKLFVFQKLLHGVFSCIITTIILLIIQQ